MAKFRAWELWFADVKYEDSDESKDRPVLITGTGAMYVLALKVTSTEQRPVWGEYDITYWKSAGLDHPSTVQCEKPLELQEKDFRRKIGDLHPLDVVNIRKILGMID